jgi:hypothetical protein
MAFVSWELVSECFSQFVEVLYFGMCEAVEWGAAEVCVAVECVVVGGLTTLATALGTEVLFLG